MSRYIDSEKLIAEIERRIIEHRKSLKKDITLISEAILKGSLGAYESIWHFIISLQQEQPETDGDDGKFVKILVRKEFAEQFQRLGDEIQAGQSSFVGAMNQQEQPEGDLEKEITKWIDSGDITDTRFDDYDDSDIERTARHFFELGLNARKK